MKTEKKEKGVRGNIIQGGLVKPNTSNMTEEESTEALREYAKERMAYMDNSGAKGGRRVIYWLVSFFQATILLLSDWNQLLKIGD